jgi:hypothetical protein
MKNILRPLGAAVAVCASALLVSSCYYDPAYSSTSVSGSYSSGGYGGGYGYGHGYGGSSFSTSILVGTGNAQWGYDPYAQAYYDYRRRAYYDPYVYGYYPVGYRPPILVGCPHPYGYRPGRYCPPPRVVRYNTMPNYRNRESAYRASNYDWARQVRQKPVVNRPEERRPSTGRGDQGWNHTRPTESRTPTRNTNVRPGMTQTRTPQANTRSPQTNTRQQQAATRSYQTPVNQRNVETRSPQRGAPARPEARGVNRVPQPQAAPPSRNQRQEAVQKEEAKQKGRQEESRKVRGLGQSRR